MNKNIIKIPQDHMSDIRWLLSAKLEDNAKRNFNLTYLHVNEKEMVTTDGKRMHILRPKKQILEPGNYSAIKLTTKEIHLVKKDYIVFPNYKPLVEIKCEPVELNPDWNFAINPGWISAIIASEIGLIINQDYLKDAFGIGSYHKITARNKDGGIVLFSSTLLAKGEKELLATMDNGRRLAIIMAVVPRT